MNKNGLIERIDSETFAYPDMAPETEDDTTVEFKKGYNCACDNIKRLVEQKLDEPKTVIIPKYVAEYLNNRKEKYAVGGLCAAINIALKRRSELATWMNNNVELFARAWLDGYEVEKEPVWVVENEDGYRLHSIVASPGNSLNWSFDSKNKNYIEFKNFETAKKAAYLVTGNVTEIKM